MSSDETDGGIAREAPLVSVVVPVRNDPRRVALCIEALRGQTYPRDRYEVIVVDNGSTDGTRDEIERHPVTLLVEDRIRSSYAARNRGIRAARGEVIALTDADCRPVAGWIEEGVRALAMHGADLAGGHVRFVYSRRPSGAEVYDALSNMQQERTIRERRVAKTANLFIRAGVFDSVGMFPDTIQSGGDVYWTGRATTLGHVLVYARQAEVAHPTRRLRALLEKQYRVGRGRYDRRVLELGDAAARRPGLSAGSVSPPGWSYLRRSMARQGIHAAAARSLRVWGAGWLCRLTTALGSATRWAECRIQGDGRGASDPAALPESPLAES